MMLSECDVGVLNEEGAFRGVPVADFACVDPEGDYGVTEAWWHLVGLVSEVSSVFPQALSEELVTAVLPAGPMPLTTPGVTVGMRLYGGEYGLRNLWTGEVQPLFPASAYFEAAGSDFVQVYPASCHSAQCVDNRSCQLECTVDDILRGFGLLQ
jgi:hypothetical protein